MNKTLKFLLAITLFVAILAIATGVNAATYNKGIDMDKLTTQLGDTVLEKSGEGYVTKAEVDVADVTVPAGENAYDYIKVNGNVTINAATGGIASPIVVESGKLTIVAGTIKGDIEVRNGATLVVKGGTIGVADTNTVKNAGTVELLDGTITSKVVNADNGIVYSQVATTFDNAKGTIYGTMNDKGTATPIAPTGKTAVELKNSIKVNDKEYNAIYLSNEQLAKIAFSFKAWTDSTTSTKVLEAGKTYNKIDIVAEYEGKELKVAALALKVADNVAEDGYTLNATTKEVKISEDAKTVTLRFTNPWAAAIANTTVEATEKVEVTLGAQPTTEPTATPSEAPATTAPADDNKGDKDETPKTGDQIIPATALLAVVVVANVVYFAKSKRS